MFSLEYRFTHSYVDKFSKPFHRSITLAEKDLSRLTTQTVFAVDNISDSFKKISKTLNITPKIKIDKGQIEKSLKLIKNAYGLSQNIELVKANIEPNKAKLDKINAISVKANIEPNKAKLDKINAISVKANIEPNKAELVKANIEPNKAKLDKINAISVKANIEPNKAKLDKINAISVKANIEPNKAELDRLQNEGIRLNMFIANINNSDIKEQLLSYSESLYEATKYGLGKVNLGKEIASQVKSLEGLASLTDIGNAVVSGLKAGIRGSEKELAEYGKQIFLYKEITEKSFEESAQVIFKLKDKYKITSETINEVIDEIATLRKNFKITEDELVSALDTARNEFGFIISAMDKSTKTKFIDGILRWSTSLQNMHIPLKESMDVINKALTGDQQALRVLAQGGLSISQIQNALQSGDIESIAKGYEEAVIKIGNMLKNASPIVRKQYIEFFGLTEDMASAFIEASNNAQEFRKQTEKAFNIKINKGEAVKQINESTNVITKGINKIKNELTGTAIDLLPNSVVDTISSIDFKDVALYGLALKGLWNVFGGKVPIPKVSIPNFSFSKLADVGVSAKNFLPSLGGLGKIPKVGLAGAVVGSAIGVGSAMMGEGDKTEKVSGAVGSVAGSTAGAVAGALIGSAILPGIGTTIGGILGSVGGGFIGEWLGGKIGGLFGSNEDKESSQPQANLQTLEVPPPKNNSEDGDILSVLYLILSQLIGINSNTSTLPQIKFILSQLNGFSYPTTSVNTSVPVILPSNQRTPKPKPKGKDPAGLPPLSEILPQGPLTPEQQRKIQEEVNKIYQNMNKGFNR